MKFHLSFVLAAFGFVLNGGANALNVVMPGSNYDPYMSDSPGAIDVCKSAADVDADLRALQPYVVTIRTVMNMKCDTKFILQSAKALNVSVYLVLALTTVSPTFEEGKMKLQELMSSEFFSIVSGISVGNNVIHEKILDMSTAIQNLETIQKMLREQNRTLPVTMTEDPETYDNSNLAAMVDTISVSVSPFLDGLGVNQAVSDILRRLQSVRASGQRLNKPVVLVQIGWASGGGEESQNLQATPEAQAAFLSNLHQVCSALKIPYSYYTAFDRRIQGVPEVQHHFGLFQEDRTLKSSIQNLVIPMRTSLHIKNERSNLYLYEFLDGLYMKSVSTDPLETVRSNWYYDTTTQLVRSVGSDKCLALYQYVSGGYPTMATCSPMDGNLKWIYDSNTRLLQHASQNLCLNTDMAMGYSLTVYACAPGNPKQEWIIENI
ncbi:hypothetical protein CCR75_009502 [Bremia lactucae]|uniref:glucan endo-1,3-beta-D-glucosidase n=1 Tax=Bremia lactucae TaxID=4779 RepID=A0A976FMX9_BRELC|nr:hypothetical protein CCR75_009502 [Bremia lactucae]